MIIAGSDTTATALTCAVLELARNPDQQRKLRKELAECMRDRTEHVAIQDVVKCEHLKGVMLCVCTRLCLLPLSGRRHLRELRSGASIFMGT